MNNYSIIVDDNGVLKEFYINSNSLGEVTLPINLVNNSQSEVGITLKLEDNVWFVEKSEELALISNNNTLSGNNIETGQLLEVIDDYNDCIATIFIIAVEMQSISMEKYYVSKETNISIGRSEENDICYTLSKNISRKHAAIHIGENREASVHDLSSNLGIYVNNVRVTSSVLKIGDIVSVLGLKIIYLGDFIGINAMDSSYVCKLQHIDISSNCENHEDIDNDNFYIRSPRIFKSLEKEDLEIDCPPATHKSKQMPLILTMGPSMTMAIAMLVSLGLTIANAGAGGSRQSIAVSGVTALSMLVGVILWPIIFNRYHKMQEIKEENFRQKQYMKYLQKQDEILREKADRNFSILNENYYPSPEQIINYLKDENLKRRLWERVPSDSDFMRVRLGSGNQPFDVNIVTQKEKFSLVEDPLNNELKKLVDKYKFLSSVPVTVSLLEEKTIGLIGKRKEIINNAMSIAFNLASLHSYDEVKLVFVYNNKESKYFEWTKMIPHTWNNERSIRYISTNRDETHRVFTAIDELVKERERDGSRIADALCLPQYVVFIFDDSLVKDEPLMRYINNSNNQVGISSIFVYSNVDRLPIDCRAIVQNDGQKCGVYIKNKNANGFIEFKPDKISIEQLEFFSSFVAPLEVKIMSNNMNIPESLKFLDIYKVGNVKALKLEDRWSNSEPHKSLAAPIGVKSGGAIFSLDIHESYHGPHGLVAGMTGSGKSEFLQAYIMSLAINFHPHDVSFILIDFKGGGMANCFDGIPHIAGKITNLSGNQLRRSLISIRAELKKRQKLFSELNINHIDKYHKLYKDSNHMLPSMPHLIIISDEFAQLKSQQPEFMKELIDVAQIGRSLGVHMILATQKPAGVVDDQIWGNSRFRVCLKVLDKHDSNEMIKKPDAAAIKLPGRCYIQVGFDEIFEHVQSGYSGSEYIPTNTYIDIEDKTIKLIDNCANVVQTAKGDIGGSSTGQTQMEAIVSHIKEVAIEKDIKATPLWLEALPPILPLSSIDSFNKTSFDGSKWMQNDEWLNPVIGMADYPEEQVQFPLKAELGSKGHIAVYGNSGSGKTTYIQTLIYSLACTYSPEEFNLYVIDLGGRTLGVYSQLPHCGDVVYADDKQGIETIVNGLLDIIEERKLMFSNVNVGGVESYIQTTGEKIPAMVLCIDNYIVLHERYYELEEDLVSIARDGSTYGIYLVVTGSTEGSIHRLTDYFKNFFVLQMNDSYAYKQVIGSAAGLEPEPIKGRGLTDAGVPVEFQTAIAVNHENEAIRINEIKKVIDKMIFSWDGNKPISFIDKMSSQNENTNTSNTTSNTNINNTNKSITKVKKKDMTVIEYNENALFIGMDTTRSIQKSIELKDVFSFLVGGLGATGKTTTIKSIAKDIIRYPDRKLVIIDKITKDLEGFSKSINPDVYISTCKEFDSFVQLLKVKVVERMSLYNEVKELLEDEEEVYGCMQKYDKYFIVVHDFAAFYEMISDAALIELEKMMEVIEGLNIYFITGANFVNLREDFSGQVLYKKLIETDTGIIMGGNINKQTCITFNNMSALDRNKSLPLGTGILFEGEKYKEIQVLF
ncbi:type VII secretion protein EssC [Clostridium folliculivorans]|uniref:type VII secretion protein EssC n=1 Tax=Clostridium folliculivorans TaxID=2886038 RepID=UPI0021C25B0D|nr:type VII secretion protein EssC [Clostridium folliculivorans]GKU29314.1 type VII secretion protein EssC [Clostridium folliculivorans]